MRPMDWKRRSSVWLAVFFGAGRLPWAPGTWGSLAALLLFYPLGGHPWVLAGVTVLLTAISIPACTVAEEVLGETDPSCVVVDEVVGMGVAMSFLPQQHFFYYAISAFVLFRLFDIWKPFPWRKLQHLPGGWGIVVDDLGAGLYANLFLQAGALGLSLVV
jgi:phosphatidylglycerophosphatase A